MEVALEERVLVVAVSLPAAAAVVALSDALHATPHIPVAYDTNVTPMSYFPVLAYSMSKLQNSRNLICSAHPGYQLLFLSALGVKSVLFIIFLFLVTQLNLLFFEMSENSENKPSKLPAVLGVILK